MHYLQNPMTGIENLQKQIRQGFVVLNVPFENDIYWIKDKALGYDRYTYSVIKNKKVLQSVTFNGCEELENLPCFSLFYGTIEEFRGQGLTQSFVRKSIDLFLKDLPRRYKEFHIEVAVDFDNAASIQIAKKIFGNLFHESFDKQSQTKILVWQHKVIREKKA